MAVLGRGGALRLRRKPPDPVPVTSDAIDAATFSLVVTDPRIWSGDRVRLNSASGLPFNIQSLGDPNSANLAIPDNPDGYNMYAGGPWLPSSVRTHIVNDTSKFYRSDNNAPFYVTSAAVGLTTSTTYFAYRDQLDRISFYTTRANALRGLPENRIPLFNSDFGTLTITVLVNNNDWHIQADLQDWKLNLAAAEVNTTALGERFGDVIKDIVSGGGSLDFLIDRTDSLINKDITFLLNLLLMVEKGCEAEAEFWLIQDRPENANNLLPGDLYYETTIVIVSQAINTRADEIIAGSLDFVTVREIALRMGTS